MIMFEFFGQLGLNKGDWSLWQDIKLAWRGVQGVRQQYSGMVKRDNSAMTRIRTQIAAATTQSTIRPWLSPDVHLFPSGIGAVAE